MLATTMQATMAQPAIGTLNGLSQALELKWMKASRLMAILLVGAPEGWRGRILLGAMTAEEDESFSSGSETFDDVRSRRAKADSLSGMTTRKARTENDAR
jgi:hypothetical protein